jgi:lactoylglutathione lyase
MLRPMSTAPILSPNISQVVPFFMVTDMPRSLRFYMDGLGFTMKQKWTPDASDQIRWCWLERGAAALMLQSFHPTRIPAEKLGLGASIWFQCDDSIALYREFQSRGLNPQEPFVGNGLWDTHILDPDGYHLHFESPTDVPEETKLSDLSTEHK